MDFSLTGLYRNHYSLPCLVTLLLLSIKPLFLQTVQILKICIFAKLSHGKTCHNLLCPKFQGGLTPNMDWNKFLTVQLLCNSFSFTKLCFSKDIYWPYYCRVVLFKNDIWKRVYVFQNSYFNALCRHFKIFSSDLYLWVNSPRYYHGNGRQLCISMRRLTDWSWRWWKITVWIPDVVSERRVHRRDLSWDQRGFGHSCQTEHHLITFHSLNHPVLRTISAFDSTNDCWFTSECDITNPAYKFKHLVIIQRFIKNW